MGEMGGAVTYLYWSEQRITKFLNDNGIERPPITTTFTSPGLSMLPIISRAITRRRTSRSQITDLIENSLGQSAVTAFDAPAPIQYAKGLGDMTFGEFVVPQFVTNRIDLAAAPEPTSPAVIFTQADYNLDNGDSVAV
jgi:hypothetical protein